MPLSTGLPRQPPDAFRFSARSSTANGGGGDPDDDAAPGEHEEGRHGSSQSRFTYRHLADLAAAVPSCPLRVIAHIDLDAYYAQCEMLRLGVDEDTPLVVQQWRNIIAVNYPARKFGIGRMINVNEAKRLCPALVVQHVPTWKEGDTQWAYHDDAFDKMDQHKVSLEPYRIRSREILATIKASLPSAATCRIEKAGIDEVFVDLSAHIHDVLVHERYADVLADYRAHREQQQPDGLAEAPLPLPPVTEAELDWAATGSNVIDTNGDSSDRGGSNKGDDSMDNGGGDGDGNRDGDGDGDGDSHGDGPDRRRNGYHHHENETDKAGNNSTVDWDDVAMWEGARIVRAVRQALYDQLRFRCTAGVSSNKMLSKLGSSQHKPNKQTVVRPRAVSQFLAGLPAVTKLRSLGGKLGARLVAAFDTTSVAELRTVPLTRMQATLRDPELGQHIYWMLRGVDHSEVTARTELKSIISAKSFQPPLTTLDQVRRWLRVYVGEIKCRLLDEKLSLALLAAATVAPAAAVATTMTTASDKTVAASASPDETTDESTASVQDSAGVWPQPHQKPPQPRLPQTIRLHYGNDASWHWRSRQTKIPRDGMPLDEEKLLRLGNQLVEQTHRLDALFPCTHLALSVDGFEDPAKGNKSIEAFFRPRAPGAAALADRVGPTYESSHSELAAAAAAAAAGGEDDVTTSANVDSQHDTPLAKRRRTDAPEATLVREVGEDADEKTKVESDLDPGEQAAATSSSRSRSSSSGRRSEDESKGEGAGAGAGENKSSSRNNNDKNNREDAFSCGRCSQTFAAATQLQEHEDWHVARALQAKERRRVLAPLPSSSSSSSSKVSSSSSANARAKPSPTPISSFFRNKPQAPSIPRLDNSTNAKTIHSREALDYAENNDSATTADTATRATARTTTTHLLICPRCAAPFGDPDGLQIHADWHFAKDLERG
ncbi:sister chromatid cohesion protein [Niveomyces insectorum RCEF 264]|uniref:Sister chromatid cohesion protein n=1 Tax=Niveomyces insectorum RCEF 264 TaxID=1081102 RepID=A0A167W4X5_9HYPO|nr:sister chromatid cohesion protein [Niveomyces insectorum RCEF 264]